MTHRIHMTLLGLAAVLAGSLSAPATAATPDGDYAVYGWGAQTCESIDTVLQGEQSAVARQQMSEWISGFISARNMSTTATYDVTPVKSHLQLLSLAHGVCRANPEALFDNVLNMVVSSFERFKLSVTGPVVEVSNGEYSVLISEGTLMRVQEMLIGHGLLDNGTADGKYGAMTRQAITEWQSDMNLQETGIPDINTLFSMARALSEQ